MCKLGCLDVMLKWKFFVHVIGDSFVHIGFGIQLFWSNQEWAWAFFERELEFKLVLLFLEVFLYRLVPLLLKQFFSESSSHI